MTAIADPVSRQGVDLHWVVGGVVALTAHAIAGSAFLLIDTAPVPAVEDPIVLIQLPPQAPPAAAAANTQQQLQPQPRPDYVPPRQLLPDLDIPPTRAPLPKEVVATPPPPPLPNRPTNPRTAPPSATPAPAQNAATRAADGQDTGTSPVPGNDPKAKEDQANYIALVNAHLARKKRYPSEAKKARQQGVVTVRFTVHRDGRVTGGSIKRSSGHDLLDSVTLELLQRVSPLPKFPKSMAQSSITLSLPIDYSLRTD